MEFKPLHEKIIFEAEEKVNLINEETSKKVAELKKNRLEKMNLEYEEKLHDIKITTQANINAQKKKMERDVLMYTQKTKEDIVNNLFLEVYDYIKNLQGDDLCNYMHALIKQSDIVGNEKIVVSINNKDKYLQSLSSKNNENDLDKLNSKDPLFQFTLVFDKLFFDEGFMLIKEDFDLIFDFKQIVENYQQKQAKSIYEMLFDHE